MWSPKEHSGSVGAVLLPSNVTLGMPFGLSATQLPCKYYGNGHSMTLKRRLEDQMNYYLSILAPINSAINDNVIEGRSKEERAYGRVAGAEGA